MRRAARDHVAVFLNGGGGGAVVGADDVVNGAAHGNDGVGDGLGDGHGVGVDVGDGDGVGGGQMSGGTAARFLNPMSPPLQPTTSINGSMNMGPDVGANDTTNNTQRGSYRMTSPVNPKAASSVFSAIGGALEPVHEDLDALKLSTLKPVDVAGSTANSHRNGHGGTPTLSFCTFECTR